MLAEVGTLASGLFCRDLDALGYGYEDAVAYWTREGSPDRMDADVNGIPCETMYDGADVLAFWGDPLPTTTTTVDVLYSVATHGLHPGPLPASGGAFGSGCSPGSDTLPDGIWWGYVRSLSASSITFDLACLRWIDDPNDDAIEEGGWEIENDNPKTRVAPVHPLAQAICDKWNCARNPFPYADWMTTAPVLPDPGSELAGSGIWLYINDGKVTEVGEAGLAG